MSDVLIRTEGRAGRITLNRPEALNAVTYEMVLAIDAALKDWAEDPEVALLVIDAAEDKAFSAGGDIAELYRTGKAGDLDFGRRFWRDEYRMNRRLFHFPKPVVSFLHGFTMGGGVGVGCHASHRIVDDSARIAMPECGVGLVPDVGGSLILARAPGRLGEYLGTTGFRMGPGDAIHAGFADHYLPRPGWDTLKAHLCDTGDAAAVARAAMPAPDSPLARDQGMIDHQFGASDFDGILASLRGERGKDTAAILMAFDRNAPLSMACTVEMLRRLRAGPTTIEAALDLEYRFTWRAMAQGDFLEGIRAAIIDKDRSPRWRHRLGDVPMADVDEMLRPLEDAALTWEE
jgi:enoyl-CoA hydratase